MRYFLSLLLILLLGPQLVASQEPVTDLKELHQLLSPGDRAFKLMKTVTKYQESQTPPNPEENGIQRELPLDFRETGEFVSVELEAAATLKLSTSYTDSSVTIKALENTFCPTISINLKTHVALIKDQSLNSVEKITVESKSNLFRSAWHGYQWQAETTKKNTLGEHRITIGKLEENGAVYLEIIWLEGGQRFHYRLLG
ncbi:MAG: hypothetical protein AAF361_08540 [Bacteroidota bacterium]